MISVGECAFLACLLLASAFFSGSETALFSLTRHDLRRLRESGSRFTRIVLDLVGQPRAVLVTLLFGNALVNVLFFSTAVGVGRRVGEARGHGWGAAVAVLSLAIVILFGEVTPKILAVTSPRRGALLISLPFATFHRLVSPVRTLFDRLVYRRIARWLLVPVSGKAITPGELAALLEMGEDRGLLASDESDLLQQVIELRDIRVREVLVPRVDIVAIDVNAGREATLALARARRVPRIPVHRGSMDTLYGLVRVKDLVLDPDRPLAELVRPVPFVPETLSVEALLARFRHEGQSVAIVVDEYGGTEGLVDREDILEELVGELEDEFEHSGPAVERITEGVYRVRGGLGWRAWGDLFRTELTGEGWQTIGGFVMTRLGRVPRVGDEVTWRNLVFRVERVRRRRVDLLTVEVAGPASYGAG